MSVASSVQRAADSRLARLVLILVTVAALGVAVALRLFHIQRYVLRGDEGVYLQSLTLMRTGYLPFRDFFSSQGPLFLPLLFPFSLLGSLVGPRLGVILIALLGLLVLAALGQRLGGPAGALLAILVAGLSPNLLFVSRLAIAEAPAAALAAVSVWLATRAPRRTWLVAAAIVLAVAILIKPLAGAAGVALVALTLEARWRSRAWAALLVDVLLMGVAALLVVVVASVPFGLSAVQDQFVDFHLEVTRVEQRGRSVGGWDNVDAALPQLVNEGVGTYALAAVGLLVVLVSGRGGLAWGSALWLLATIAALWAYVPFYDRYLVFLLGPFALLAARCAGAVSRFAAPNSGYRLRSTAGWVASTSGLLGIGALVVYLVSLPGLAGQDLRIAQAPWEPLRLAEYQAAADLAQVTLPSEMVATDNQSIAVMAGRVVPPELVDTSEARVTSGSIDADDVIRSLDSHEVRAVVWWSDDRFGKLRGFKKQLEQRYVPYKQYAGGRTLYLRRDLGPAAGGPPASDAPDD